MNTRRFLTMLLCIMLLVSLGVPALAEDGSGSMGERAFWRYDSATETITISGAGDVTVFSTDHSPWHDHYYGEVTRVIVEEGITGLYGEVFAYLPRLAEVSLPSTLKGMGGDTFLLSGNEALDIVIPDGVTELGTAFHSSCIRSIRLGRGLTELAAGAFTESHVVSVDLCNVTIIGQGAFARCTQLKDIDLSRVTEIGPGAFSSCGALQSADLRNVPIINNSAFNTSGLETVVFGSELLRGGTIYAYNFQQRGRLKQVYIYGTMNEWNRLLRRSAEDGNEGLRDAEILPVRFADVEPMRWSSGAVNRLAEDGVIGGYGDGTFRPLNEVTRAEFSKMLNMVLPKNRTVASAQRDFPDVQSGDWFAPYVKTLAAQGIVNGFEDGTFRPDERITRQDMATMIGRMIDLYRLDLREKASSVVFADAGRIADYASGAVSRMQRLGIVSGFEDGTFRPAEHASREQTAQMICNLLQAMQNGSL